MKKTVTLFLLFVLILSACQSALTVQKRRYRPGLYIHWKGHEANSLKFPKLKVPFLEEASNIQNVHSEASQSEQIKSETDKVGNQKENRTFESTLQSHSQPKSYSTSLEEKEMASLPTIENIDLKNEESKKKSDLIWMTSILAVLGGAFVMIRKKESTYKLAAWAKKNKRASRWTIAFISTGIGYTAAFAGNELAYHGFHATEGVRETAIGIALAALLLYPIKGAKSLLLKRTLLRQKLMDFILVTAGSIALFFGGMEAAERPEQMNSFESVVTSFSLPNHALIDLENSSTFDASDDLASPLRSQSHVENTPGSIMAKILLTLLAVALAVFLLYIVAIISCNVSCSGNQGAGTVILIGGWALITLAAILLIRKIWLWNVGGNNEKIAPIAP